MKKISIPTLEQVDFQLETLELEEDLFKFVLWVFEKIYKAPFIINWHHEMLCKILMDIHSGKLQHTIVTIPPRYTKTEIVVKIFPAWALARNPKCKFLHLAYSDELALDNSSFVKMIVESEEFQERWPIRLKRDSTAKKKWKSEEGGEFSAAASGGSVTGFGAGRLGSKKFAGALIIDDPLKPEDSNSDTVRNSINRRFPQTIKSRLNDRLTPILIIMQRLHEDDPVGFLLGGGTELKFTHINLPALNEDGPSEYDPRKIGEALWPDKHTEEELKFMQDKSATTFAGQYQQRPAPAEGNIFKRFRFYTEYPKDLVFKVQSWDFTFKKSKQSDYVVGTFWGKSSTKDLFLLDLVRDRMSFTESLSSIKKFTKKHPSYNAILVEAKANGEAIIDSIKSEVKKVIGISPTSAKEERAEAVAPIFEAGEIWLPHPSIAPWVEDFVNELKVFPNGKHDDQVDSMTQAVEYLDRIGSSKKISDVNEDLKPYRKAFLDKKKKARNSRIKVKEY